MIRMEAHGGRRRARTLRGDGGRRRDAEGASAEDGAPADASAGEHSRLKEGLHVV